MRVRIGDPVHADALALLRAGGWQAVEDGPAEALIVRMRPVGAADMAGLRLVSKHGVGVDNIDLAAARAAGVVVANTPGANAAGVAEQAVMLLLALARDLDGQRAGRATGIRGLGGRRLAVVGFGASGQAVARLALAFGMQVCAWSPGIAGRPVPPGVAVAETLGAVLDGAEAVSLHLPGNAATMGMIGAAEIARLAPGAFLVNCARGGIVDEGALIAALESGHLGGAGLDVTEVEPLPPDAALRRAPRIILTPHAAGLSDMAFRQVGLVAAQNVIDWGEGRLDPRHTVVPGPDRR